MLFKRINGNFTSLGSHASGPLPAGTQLQLTAVGSSLVFSENGIAEVTATDTSVTGGSPGIMAYGSATAQSWTGGNAAGTYSVGGTVSGLSGTVVLQDNGGDNLSVTANGSFTFATALPAGGSLQRHGGDQPLRADLHRRQRDRRRRHRQHHQRRRHLHRRLGRAHGPPGRLQPGRRQPRASWTP